MKHTVVNDIITESYLGFTITPGLAAKNEGMIPGDYALRGGVDESSLQDKPIFILRMVVNHSINTNTIQPYLNSVVNPRPSNLPLA